MSLYNKILRISDHFNLYKSYIYRPLANKEIKLLLNSKMVRQENSLDGILADGLWDHPHHWLRLAIFQLATQKIFGTKISFIFEEQTRKRVYQSAKSFSPNNIFIIPNNIDNEIIKKSELVSKQIKKNRDIFKINFGSMYPSHFFYDGVLKELNVGSLDLKKHNIIPFIAKTFHMIKFYNSVFKKNHFNALIVSHPTTIRFSTLIWSALNHKIPVYVLNYRNTFITIRKLTSLEELNKNPEDSPTLFDLKNIPKSQKKELIEYGQQFLHNRFSSSLSEISIASKKNSNNFNLKKNEIINYLGLYPKKQTIVVFCNCWPDFPNSQGINHFDDFEDFFNYTINLAKRMKNYNWVFKAHPAEYMYGKKITLKKLMKNINFSHIRMVYSELDWNSICKIMDCAVTTTGSIGHEYVSLGGKVIIARPNSYTNLGFSHFAKSKLEFVNLIKNFEKLAPPSQKQKETALIYTAIKFGNSIKSEFQDLHFPLGRLSYRLWPGLKNYIRINDKGINKEINTINKFIISNLKNYSVFKYM